MAKLSRRSLLLAGAGAAASRGRCPGRCAPGRGGRDAGTIVIGAGVFGAWTATRLRDGGRQRAC